MSAARAVTATFAKFRLTVATAGVGAGIVRGPGLACVRPAVVGNECTETYAAGAVVTLTARAAAGSGFTGWGGACAGAGTADCVVTMSAARAVTATFAKFRLTVATAGVGAGIVRGPGLTCVRPAVVGNECTETYAAGAVVTLTARAAAGSGFTGWGGACAGAGTADCVVTMSAARAVTATFAKFRLTVATAGVGAGIVRGPGLTCVRPAVVGNECTETYAAGAVVTLSARAAAGSGFTGWGGACASAGTADCVVTMSAARAVTARLLNEQGLARLAGRLHYGGVEHRGDCDDHGVDARVAHEITVVIVKGAAISRGERLALGTVPSADGDEGCLRQVLHDVAGVARPVLAEADQPDTEHVQMLKLPERFVQVPDSSPSGGRRFKSSHPDHICLHYGVCSGASRAMRTKDSIVRRNASPGGRRTEKYSRPLAGTLT